MIFVLVIQLQKHLRIGYLCQLKSMISCFCCVVPIQKFKFHDEMQKKISLFFQLNNKSSMLILMTAERQQLIKSRISYS